MYVITGLLKYSWNVSGVTNSPSPPPQGLEIISGAEKC